MPEIEISLIQREPIRLKYALLIYGGDDGVAITKNKVDEKGHIGIGEPIDAESFIEEFNRNLDKSNPDLSDYGGSRRGAVGSVVWTTPTMLAENSQYRIWWTPAQTRQLFIAGKPKSCWIPTLVWVGHRRQHTLFMLATAGKLKPGPKTAVYRPQFGPVNSNQNHIHTNSEVCLGTMNPGSYTPKEWMDTFYDTNFKTADGLPPKPHDITKTYKRLGPFADVVGKLSSDRFAP